MINGKCDKLNQTFAWRYDKSRTNVAHKVHLVENDKGDLAHHLGAAKEHVAQNLGGHDQARGVRRQIIVARHEADVAKLLAELAILLIRQCLDGRRVQDALLVAQRHAAREKEKPRTHQGEYPSKEADKTANENTSPPRRGVHGWRSLAPDGVFTDRRLARRRVRGDQHIFAALETHDCLALERVEREFVRLGGRGQRLVLKRDGRGVGDTRLDLDVRARVQPRCGSQRSMHDGRGYWRRCMIGRGRCRRRGRRGWSIHSLRVIRWTDCIQRGWVPSVGISRGADDSNLRNDGRGATMNIGGSLYIVVSNIAISVERF